MKKSIPLILFILSACIMQAQGLRETRQYIVNSLSNWLQGIIIETADKSSISDGRIKRIYFKSFKLILENNDGNTYIIPFSKTSRKDISADYQSASLVLKMFNKNALILIRKKNGEILRGVEVEFGLLLQGDVKNRLTQVEYYFKRLVTLIGAPK